MCRTQEIFLYTRNKYIERLNLFFFSAVLVYLNYKNAYEHWNEQRLALNKEVGIHFDLFETCSIACLCCN